MTWNEVFLLLIAVFAATTALFVVPFFLVEVIDKTVESVRRKRHPEYFKYWDKSKYLAFKRAEEFNQRNGRIQHYIKMYSDGLRDGECDAEYYRKHMNIRMMEFEQLCDWFNAEGRPIDELLHKADQYAKEHKLKWGIIYEDKCA